MAGKSSHKSPSDMGQKERTNKNSSSQAKARERRALRKSGQAAQRRQKRREYLKEQRLTDPSYARKLPDPEPKIIHNALNKDTRGTDQVIYSVILTPYRD